MTASLAWHFSSQEAEVCYLLPGSPRMRDLHEFLAALAVIAPLAADSLSKDPLCEMNLESGDEYNIVVTSRRRGTVPTALWNSSYFVFVGEREDAASHHRAQQAKAKTRRRP
jgi:hypothetical protein